MKKTIKVVVTILLILAIVIISGNIYARTVRFDLENISIWFLDTESREIEIRNTRVNNYTIYYQWVFISDSVYEEFAERYDEIADRIRELFNDTTEELEMKQEEAERLFQIWVEADEYDRGSEEAIAAREDWMIALSEIDVINDEIRERGLEYRLAIREIIPMFVDGNWVEITGQGEREFESTIYEVTLDLDTFRGEATYALWIRVIDSNGTHYNNDIVTAWGTGTDVPGGDVRDDRNNGERDSEADDDETNANSIMIGAASVVGAIVIAVVVIVVLKKFRQKPERL
ncbi:MAG: hypothetical protein FWC79_06370 [Oscillospiraceae bacterium]|nr:hypothetical protein [Oscillospiraceae bacterium]